MGYFLCSTPEPKWYGRSALEDFYPPFEGKVEGLPPLPESMQAKLFHLRDKWIELFIKCLAVKLGVSVENVGNLKDWAIDWLDRSGTFPKTREQLAADILDFLPIHESALACMDAWHAL